MATKITIEGFIGQVYDYMQDELKTTSYKGIEAKLQEVEGDIDIHINSKGGDAFEGIAIMNALNNYTGGNKTAIVDGFCASAGTLPLFAMDTVKAHKTALFVFHKGATMAFGHADDLRETADELDTIDGTVMDLYMERFTGTQEELDALMTADKIITAQQALEYGFVDELITKEVKEDSQPKALLESNKLTETVELSKEHADEMSDRLALFVEAVSKFTVDSN